MDEGKAVGAIDIGFRKAFDSVVVINSETIALRNLVSVHREKSVSGQLLLEDMAEQNDPKILGIVPKDIEGNFDKAMKVVIDSEAVTVRNHGSVLQEKRYYVINELNGIIAVQESTTNHCKTEDGDDDNSASPRVQYHSEKEFYDAKSSSNASGTEIPENKPQAAAEAGSSNKSVQADSDAVLLYNDDLKTDYKFVNDAAHNATQSDKELQKNVPVKAAESDSLVKAVVSDSLVNNRDFDSPVKASEFGSVKPAEFDLPVKPPECDSVNAAECDSPVNASECDSPVKVAVFDSLVNAAVFDSPVTAAECDSPVKATQHALQGDKQKPNVVNLSFISVLWCSHDNNSKHSAELNESVYESCGATVSELCGTMVSEACVVTVSEPCGTAVSGAYGAAVSTSCSTIVSETCIATVSDLCGSPVSDLCGAPVPDLSAALMSGGMTMSEACVATGLEPGGMTVSEVCIKTVFELGGMTVSEACITTVTEPLGITVSEACAASASEPWGTTVSEAFFAMVSVHCGFWFLMLLVFEACCRVQVGGSNLSIKTTVLIHSHNKPTTFDCPNGSNLVKVTVDGKFTEIAFSHANFENDVRVYLVEGVWRVTIGNSSYHQVTLVSSSSVNRVEVACLRRKPGMMYWHDVIVNDVLGDFWVIKENSSLSIFGNSNCSHFAQHFASVDSLQNNSCEQLGVYNFKKFTVNKTDDSCNLTLHNVNEFKNSEIVCYQRINRGWHLYEKIYAIKSLDQFVNVSGLEAGSATEKVFQVGVKAEPSKDEPSKDESSKYFFLVVIVPIIMIAVIAYKVRIMYQNKGRLSSRDELHDNLVMIRAA